MQISKKEQIDTLFIWVGAQEGGWVVPPRNSTPNWICLPENNRTPSCVSDTFLGRSFLGRSPPYVHVKFD
jgi:hypothetical protein